MGFGGQGIVYREASGDSVIKILRGGGDRAGAEARERRRRYERLRELRSLVPDELPLLLPTAVLAPPHTGYVMARVRGHRPLTGLLRPDPDSSFTQWYQKDTGGLRRRLLIGARLARAFHFLHSLGLAYGDLSDSNVLVARNPRLLTLCLIDVDNLSLSDVPRTTVVGTERYIAPELLRGSGLPDSLTDCHSLATLIFTLLRLGHPLLGDAVLDNVPEAEETALRGELPYVEHPDNSSNRCSRLLPAELTLTTTLKELFRRAFMEGLTQQRALRPAPRQWEAALLAAADNLARCIGCGADYLPHGTACPWCGKEQTPLWRIVLYDATGTGGKALQRKVGSVVLPFPTQENAAIPRRLTEFGAEGIAGDATACLLRCNADQLVTLDNTGGRPIYLLETSAQGMRLTLVKAGEARPISDMTSIYFSDPRAISAGEGNVPHPAIRCMRLFRAAQTQGLSDREEA